MLRTHINAREQALLAISKVPAGAGHKLNRGTPREAFIKEFLADHLSERVAIGTGEIIDANSTPREARTQVDIVVYKRDYPRLHLGGGINAFLAESVVASIEVKSLLTADELKKAVENAHQLKTLERNVIGVFSAGYTPPSILSYVVAYEGPQSMATVHSWISQAHNKLSISYPAMPPTQAERISIASPSVDGVYVLGKGFVQFDNIPLGFVQDETRKSQPNLHWMIADTPDGNLLMLFLLLTVAMSGVSGSLLNPGPYLKDFRLLYGVAE